MSSLSQNNQEPQTPTTPVRPPRPVRHASHTSSSSVPPLTPDSASPFSTSVGTPITPQTPAPSSFRSDPYAARRKSTASLSSRRKPVPISTEDEYALTELSRGRSIDTPSVDPFVDPLTPSPALRTATTPSTAVSEPPRYLLEVLPPPAPPTYLSEPVTPIYIECGLPSVRFNHEQLPVYAEDVQTEPDTLARKCWLWGFLFPLLWLVGMAILCTPLRPTEEEEDADKAQKLQEMIVILRKVELKYAKRCAWSFGIFVLTLSVIVTIALIVPRFT